MKIKINTKLGGNEAGDTIDVTPKTADYLTEQGYVDDTKTKTDTKAKTDK